MSQQVVNDDILGNKVSSMDDSGLEMEMGDPAGGPTSGNPLGDASPQGVFFGERGNQGGMSQRVFQRDTLELVV